MQWIAPSEKDTDTETLERQLWEAAEQLRANSGLTSAQDGQPVLGLTFLRFAGSGASRKSEGEPRAAGDPKSDWLVARGPTGLLDVRPRREYLSRGRPQKSSSAFDRARPTRRNGESLDVLAHLQGVPDPTARDG